MARRGVIIELQPGSALAASATLAASAGAALADPATLALAGISFDAGYSPVPVMHPSAAAVAIEAHGINVDVTTSYVIRGEIDDRDVDNLPKLASQPGVLGIYADAAIAPAVVCATSPPVGTDANVESLLCRPEFAAKGLDGTNVLVAIVDTGFNVAYLRGKGKPALFNPGLSWTAQAGQVPGSVPVNHGTMCAFDVQIMAPACTLLDIVLLLPGVAFGGVLSDAIRAYAHLLNNVMPLVRNGTHSGLVVNNSWAMFHASWDLPPGNPGNYSHNPNHPFNRMVASLEAAGADIVFAAGNCGAPCPDGRCMGVTTGGIFGANSHPQVLSIAGVDTTKTRVGYSNQGPGRQFANKPDFATYTHFAGSGVYSADGGTSAASPVASGVIAAVRTGLPFSASNPATSPAALRMLAINSTTPVGAPGFNFDLGFGILDGCGLAARVPPADAAPGPAVAQVGTTASVPTVPDATLGPSPVE